MTNQESNQCPSLVREATNSCLISLQSIIEVASGATLSTAKDNLTRFQTWAGDLGACDCLPSRKSADFKLRKAPEVNRRVLEILVEVLDTNQEISANLSANSHVNPSGTSNFNMEEDLCLSVGDSITSLLKVSTLHWREASRDRHAKALTSEEDLSSEYAAFVREHIGELFSKVRKQQWLCDRLTYATIMRRKLLQHAQKQAQKQRNARELGEGPADQGVKHRGRQEGSETIEHASITGMVKTTRKVQPQEFTKRSSTRSWS